MQAKTVVTVAAALLSCATVAQWMTSPPAPLFAPTSVTAPSAPAPSVTPAR